MLFMKTVVTVLGMGDRVTGKNRDTGKPFDFRKVAFGFVNNYGSNDVSVNIVDGSDLDELAVQVGCRYEAVVNQVKKVYYIDLLKPIDGL